MAITRKCRKEPRLPEVPYAPGSFQFAIGLPFTNRVPMINGYAWRPTTFFVRHGHHFPLVCWIVTAFAWLGAMLRRRTA